MVTSDSSETASRKFRYIKMAFGCQGNRASGMVTMWKTKASDTVYYTRRVTNAELVRRLGMLTSEHPFEKCVETFKISYPGACEVKPRTV